MRKIDRVCSRPGNVCGKINDDLRRLCNANISSEYDRIPIEFTRCAYYVSSRLKLVLTVAIKRWTIKSTVVANLTRVEVPVAGNEANFVDPSDEYRDRNTTMLKKAL
jgi:hypothetical protein